MYDNLIQIYFLFSSMNQFADIFDCKSGREALVHLSTIAWEYFRPAETSLDRYIKYLNFSVDYQELQRKLATAQQELLHSDIHYSTVDELLGIILERLLKVLSENGPEVDIEPPILGQVIVELCLDITESIINDPVTISKIRQEVGSPFLNLPEN